MQTDASLHEGAAEERARALEEFQTMTESLRREVETQRFASEQRLQKLEELNELYSQVQKDASIFKGAAEERLQLAQYLDGELNKVLSTTLWARVLKSSGLSR